MQNKEATLFAPDAQPPSPEELSAMNPAELQSLIDSGAIDPSMLPQAELPYQQQGMYEAANNPYSAEIPAPNIGEVQQAAQERLVNVEKQAIDNQAAEHNESGAPFMVERAIHDKDVTAARDTVASVFDRVAVQKIEEDSLKHALDYSHVQTQNTTEIAETYSHGDSAVAKMEQTQPMAEADSPKHAAEQFAILKDKLNGKAEPMIHHISDRAIHRLRKLGIDGSKINAVEAEVIEGNGANITKSGQDEVAIEAALGNEVIKALVPASGQPRISKQLTAEIADWRQSDPHKYHRLRTSAMRYSQTGQLSQHSRREVGKLFS
jgi:hypothetical protein